MATESLAMAERTETITRERIAELRKLLETTAPLTWAHEAVPELLAEIEYLREQNTGLGVRVQEGWAKIEELRDLCGKHDPTGADHMEEMWEHAQRADAAEAQLDTHKAFVRRINDLVNNAHQLTRESLAYGMTLALSDLADNLAPEHDDG